MAALRQSTTHPTSGRRRSKKKTFTNAMILGRIPSGTVKADIEAHFDKLHIALSQIRKITLVPLNRNGIKMNAFIEFKDALSLQNAISSFNNAIKAEYPLYFKRSPGVYCLEITDAIIARKHQKQHAKLQRILNKKQRYKDKSYDPFYVKFYQWLWGKVNLEEYLVRFHVHRLARFDKIYELNEVLLRRRLCIDHPQHLELLLTKIKEHQQQVDEFNDFMQKKENAILKSYESILRKNCIITLEELKHDIETPLDVQMIMCIDDRIIANKIIKIVTLL
eukprot:168407_1